MPLFSSSKIQKWEVTEPYLDLHCSLGEGAHYEESTNSLRFVDIKQRKLHTVDLSKGPSSLVTKEFTVPVCFTADIKGVDPTEKIIVGGKNGVYILDRGSGDLKLIKNFCDATGDEERTLRTRCNDGGVDSSGRLWFGTMNDFNFEPPKAEGALYLVDSKLSITTKEDPMTIPNGIGWSLDNKTMYLNNTSEKQTLAFTTNGDGDLQDKRVFYQHKGSGAPDGLRVDAEGNLWLAIFGEGKVLRVSPDGVVIGEVTYPTSSISCPVFVGTELWVTTTDDGKSKYGGGVFKVDVGVKGSEVYKFQLDSDV